MTETSAAIFGAIVGGLLGIVGTYYATREARATALDAIKAGRKRGQATL